MAASLRNRLSALASDNLLIAAIPFLGSVLALIYEAGYLEFYDVPVSFITLDFVSVVLGSVVVVQSFAFYFVAILLASRMAENRSPVVRAIFLPTFLLVFTAPLLLLFKQSSIQWIALGALYILMVAEKVLPPAFDRTSGGRYIQRLELLLEYEAEAEEVRMANRKPRVITTIIVCIFMVAFVYGSIREIGYSSAARETKHWTVVADGSWVMVRRYGEIFVLKSLVRPEMRVGDQIRSIKATDTEAVLKLEDLGTLAPFKERRPVL